MRKSTKMDSIKAFVDGHKNLHDRGPEIDVDCSIENAEYQAHKDKFRDKLLE